MCERSRNLVTSTQGVLSDGNSGRGKHLPLVWVGACLCRQLSCVSACGTIPLFPVFRQKLDHTTHLILDVLVPALLLWQIFQGTASLLSSAPGDKLSQHGHPQNPTWGRNPTKDCHPLSSSGLVPSPRGCSSPSPGAKCHLNNCCAVLLKLKFLPEFSVTKTRGDCCGIGEQSQLLKDIWGLKDNILQEGWTSNLGQLGAGSLTPLFLVTISRVLQRELGAEMWFSPIFRRSLGRWALPEHSPLVNTQLWPPAFYRAHEEHARHWIHFFFPSFRFWTCGALELRAHMPAQHSAALDHPHYGSATELMKKLYLGYKRQAPFITLTCQLTPDVREKKLQASGCLNKYQRKFINIEIEVN